MNGFGLLAQRGYPGGHIFVMHAHLERRLIEGQNVQAPGGAQIASCGNTGNSEATHLHLEIRASRSPDFVRWAVLRDGLMDPVALFKR
jgi:murein DD-endopeptidase MepM/ murein hydrolase activator NlpD